MNFKLKHYADVLVGDYQFADRVKEEVFSFKPIGDNWDINYGF